jgi:urease accessory protein
MLAALLLADGRLPTGGHVHSAGVESAIADGRITDVDSLGAYLRGRLHTVALTEAAIAAATLLRPFDVDRLDAEADARITVPELRAVSRRLGRQLLRVASRCWPHPLLATLPAHPHQPVALGAVGVAAGVDGLTVAAVAIHHAIVTPAQSALRLLGLDPFAVAALTAALATDGERVAVEAVLAAGGPIEDLPARAGPVVDIAAATHASLPTQLFAS